MTIEECMRALNDVMLRSLLQEPDISFEVRVAASAEWYRRFLGERKD